MDVPTTFRDRSCRTPAARVALIGALLLGGCSDPREVAFRPDASGGGLDGGPADGRSPAPDAAPPSDAAADGALPDAGPGCGSPRTPWDPSEADALELDARFGFPGLGGTDITVTDAAVADDGTLYAVGYFTHAGQQRLDHVGRWAPDEGWRPLGEGSGTPGEAIVLMPDGQPVAAFRHGREGTMLRRFDGTGWRDIAELDGAVHALAVAADGALLIGGSFQHVGDDAFAHLARYDGSGFSSLGGASPNAPVTALTVRESGEACVAGPFWRIGELDALQVACLGADGWSALDLADGASIEAMAETADGTLLVGGALVTDASATAGGLARYDATTERWSLLGGGLTLLGVAGSAPGRVSDLAVLPNGDLFVAGSFDLLGGTTGRPASDLGIWDGDAWRVPGEVVGAIGIVVGTSPVVRLVEVAPDGTVFVGGQVANIDGTLSAGMLRYNGSYWTAVDDPDAEWLGLDGPVADLAAYGDCGTYVVGSFSSAGGVRSEGVLRLTAEGEWEALGRGLPADERALTVQSASAVAVHPAGDVFVGGTLSSTEDGVELDHIARWDGARWHAVGGGLGSHPDGRGMVMAMAMDRDGHLFVGGRFNRSGAGDELGNVAMWDGARWHDLGGGTDGRVMALAPLADGGIAAGGVFQRAGETLVDNVAVWRDGSWEARGTLDGEVPATLIEHAGTLFVGLSPRGPSPDAPSALRHWDGTSWQEASVSLFRVNDLENAGSTLLAVGDPSFESGSSAQVFALDAQGWEPLSGVTFDQTPRAMLTHPDGVFFGGTFRRAGDVGSISLAWLRASER